VLVQPDRYRDRATTPGVTFVNPIPRKGVEIAFARPLADPTFLRIRRVLAVANTRAIK